MKVAKYLGLLLITIVGLFLFVANFSEVASNYECTGEISAGENKHSISLFIVLVDYRWWVRLWTDSDGRVHLEYPDQLLGNFFHVVKVGNHRHIFDSPNELKGNFSTLSKTLALQTPFGFFDGKCVGTK